MNATNTPGPWVAKVHKTAKTARLQVWQDKSGQPHMPYKIADGVTFADDAALIAAAPELLAALKLAYRHLNGGADALTPMEFDAAFKMARAAIAKATNDA